MSADHRTAATQGRHVTAWHGPPRVTGIDSTNESIDAPIFTPVVSPCWAGILCYSWIVNHPRRNADLMGGFGCHS
jgi:hypothetical protein